MRKRIRGTEMYVPDNVVDNHCLSRLMDTSDEWIWQRTGIVTRRFAGKDQATNGLAVPVFVDHEPKLDSIRSDERFRALRRRIGACRSEMP